MKLNIFLLTMLPLFTINSQIVEFIGSSGGPLGEQKRDTVTFGFAHNCTVGLDQLYNEIDITNKPNDSMDLRIFQRNILNYNCLIDTSLNEIVFENSYQLKKDFRSINPKPKECYFEIENITDNFKGGYLINLKNYHSIQNKSTYIGVSAISECGDRNDYHNALNNTDSIYIWSQILPQKNTSRKDLKNYKYFSIHLKPNLTINSSNQFLENNSLNAYPNPANNYIVVECKEAIEIFNSEGDLIFSVPSNEEKKILDLNLIESGVYIIKKIDSRGNVISQFKFSKF